MVVLFFGFVCFSFELLLWWYYYLDLFASLLSCCYGGIILWIFYVVFGPSFVLL